MNKKFITKTGEEVTFGDVVTWCEEETSDNYYCKSVYKYTLTEASAAEFVEKGIITPVETKEEGEGVNFMELALQKVSERMGWSMSTTMENLSYLESNYESAVTSIFIKELALELNKKHPEVLKKMDTVWGVSLLSNSVVPIDTRIIADWNAFAAFKHKEDAEAVLKWLNSGKESEQKD